MNQTLDQARAALAEYHEGMRAGGEPHYPQWAADVVKANAMKAVRASGTTFDDNMETAAQAEITQIDRHLDAVLRASGSALKYFSMQKTLDDMRGAMRLAISSTAAEQASDARNAALEEAALICDASCLQPAIEKRIRALKSATPADKGNAPAEAITDKDRMDWLCNSDKVYWIRVDTEPNQENIFNSSIVGDLRKVIAAQIAKDQA